MLSRFALKESLHEAVAKEQFELHYQPKINITSGAVVVVEWGEGLAERLSDRHLDVRLERISNSDTRTATWQWSCR